jgi:hypothetical protein
MPARPLPAAIGGRSEGREAHLDTPYLRSERQCLLRLPKTRAIVFSIHTYVLPVTALSPEQRAAPGRVSHRPRGPRRTKGRAMSEIEAQYEAYPYPERDPADEAKRLIVGSPSHPVELDHYLFAGRRDWTKPFRALVAGGGTGDALIQLAQVLASAGRAAKITYLDLSTAARGIAEARAAARGLKGIEFHTGSLLDAAGFR